MRGKTYIASTIKEDVRNKVAYIFGADGKVTTSTEYMVFNVIVTPGKEVFILKNHTTGKNKRARKIFVKEA